jgi:hypothetical protein
VVKSLARLWQQQGKQKEAHQMLADVYHWFTEGFDTKDLQEAKALIEESRHYNGLRLGEPTFFADFTPLPSPLPQGERGSEKALFIQA